MLNVMSETTNDLVESLQNLIERKDGSIKSLKRENNALIAVINEMRRKYNAKMLLLLILLLISTTISIYQFICK